MVGVQKRCLDRRRRAIERALAHRVEEVELAEGKVELRALSHLRRGLTRHPRDQLAYRRVPVQQHFVAERLPHVHPSLYLDPGAVG